MRAVRPSEAGRFAVLCALLLAALVLGGCGYKFTGSSISDEESVNVLPAQYRDLAIIRIENPTVEPWLEPRLRSLIRDEFTRRRLTNWVERSKAAAFVTVQIKQYTRSTALAGAQDQSVKLSAGMIWTVRIRRAGDNLLLWDSGEMSQNESFYPGDADGADMRLTDLAVRRVADLMTEGY